MDNSRYTVMKQHGKARGVHQTVCVCVCMCTCMHAHTHTLLSAFYDDECFTTTFVHMVGYMGRVTSKYNEVKYETPFRYAHAEIRAQVVLIRDPTHTVRPGTQPN